MSIPVLPGLMQEFSLTIPKILEYAARWHGEQECVSRNCEGTTTIHTYSQILHRVKLLALALGGELRKAEGSIIGTLAWNNHRHLECWYAIMGIGSVCHTLNPRLSEKDLTWIINDAKDEVIFADISFADMLAKVLDKCPTVRAVIFMTDRQHMPPMKKVTAQVLCYEDLLDQQVEALMTRGFQWPDISEQAAAGLCYTSGTTGNPKGVLYSHRSNFLHSLIAVQKDAMNLGADSSVCPIVPMFHANSWGTVFAAPLVGAKLVLPGPFLDGESVYSLFETFKVTASAGVPTVWLSLLSFMESKKVKLSTVKLIAIGGSAAPRSMLEAFEMMGISVNHLWGMTETSPLGTMGAVKPLMARSMEEMISTKIKQGRPHAFIDLRICNDEGKVLPNNGVSVGHIECRGPCVIQRYFNKDVPAVNEDGFFATGDVGTLDKMGVMTITDRSKDVVKSGGEWISTIEIENLAMGHAAIREAAVCAIPSVKWGERPLLVCVLKDAAKDHEAVKAELYRHLTGKIASISMPDDIVFVPEIPHNATGKVSKLTLREMFKQHQPQMPKL